MSTSRPDPGRTPVPGDGSGLWVQVDIVASLPVSVEDIVAALWLAAARNELTPSDFTGANGAAFADSARPLVLYLLLNDHAGILAARAQVAALVPGTRLAALTEQLRAYAADLFLPPLHVDIPDTIPDHFTDGLGNGFGDGFEGGER